MTARRIDVSDELLAEIIEHEGMMFSMYDCPAGYKTIGVGHNLEAKPITERAAIVILEDDVADCLADLDRAFPWWVSLPKDAREVLINMCFNMGIGRLSAFKRMWAALEAKDYYEASQEMLDSKWAKQVGRRA